MCGLVCCACCICILYWVYLGCGEFEFSTCTHEERFQRQITDELTRSLELSGKLCVLLTLLNFTAVFVKNAGERKTTPAVNHMPNTVEA